MGSIKRLISQCAFIHILPASQPASASRNSSLRRPGHSQVHLAGQNRRGGPVSLTVLGIELNGNMVALLWTIVIHFFFFFFWKRRRNSVLGSIDIRYSIYGPILSLRFSSRNPHPWWRSCGEHNCTTRAAVINCTRAARASRKTLAL